MLTPEQDTSSETREPDVRLCAHQISVTEIGYRHGPCAFMLRLKGHMVLESDEFDSDEPVEDHRLFCVEIPMSPDIWETFVATLNDTNETVKGRTKRHGTVPVADILDFMDSIPEMFRRDPRKDDDR